MKHWTDACSKLLSKPTNLWLDELAPAFTTRVQVSSTTLDIYILQTFFNHNYRVFVDSWSWVPINL